MPKSTHNKKTRTPAEWLELMNCNVIEGMARIALGDVPCGICRGAGVTRYQPARGQDKLLERTCESCYGSSKEKISPELSGQMYAQLAKYVYPQLMQVEVRTRGMGVSTAADSLEVVSAVTACRHLGSYSSCVRYMRAWACSTYGSPMPRVPRLSAATPGPALG